jgi:hypothetical protein
MREGGEDDEDCTLLVIVDSDRGENNRVGHAVDFSCMILAELGDCTNRLHALCSGVRARFSGLKLGFRARGCARRRL